MKHAVIHTGSELRHDYVRMVIAQTQGLTAPRGYAVGERGAHE